MKNLSILFLVVSVSIFGCKKTEPEVKETIIYIHDCPDSTDTSGDLAVGDFHEGGVIFYLDETGEHGLVCSVSNVSSGAWGCMNTLVGANGNEVGDGSQNTQVILDNCQETQISAFYCDNYFFNGFSDWYLPSNNELSLIMQNKETLNPVFVENNGSEIISLSAPYWSSTEVDATHAWGFAASESSPSIFEKDSWFQAKAIRSF